MPIRRTTPQSQIDAAVRKRMEKLKRAIIYNLSAIGEKVVNHARSLPSPPQTMAGQPHQPNYIDWTANLRNSIGYVIVVDGQVHGMGKFGNGSSEGKSTGQAYARSLAPEFPEGIALVVVAGMRYASYVSAKGYDVLDSSELLAEELVPKMLEKLGLK